MVEKFKIPMNDKKFIENINKNLNKRVLRTALSLTLAAAILAPMASPMYVFADAINTPAAAQQAVKTFEGIELPNEVGLTPRRLDQPATEQEIKDAFKEAIKSKLPQGKNINDIDVVVNSTDLTNFNNNANNEDNAGYRSIGYREIKAQYKIGDKKSEEIQAKVLTYVLPFWVTNNSNNYSGKSSSFHNLKKIKVKDPNNVSLSQDEQNKIKTAFTTNNKDANLNSKDISVDAQGNITFKDKFGKEAKISSEYTVSCFPIIEDVILFSKKGENNKWTTNGTFSKTYSLKSGDNYSELRMLQNDGNIDPSEKIQGNAFGMDANLENGVVTISGTMNFNKNADAFTKFLKVYRNGSNYFYKDVSNRINFRTIGVKEPETIYRNLDEESEKVTIDTLKDQLQVDGVGTTSSDSNRQQKQNEIKSAVTKELTDTEFNKISHDTKKFYTAKGKLKYGNSESEDIEVKVRYYTKKFEVLVQNPMSLTENEKTAIKKAAAKANGLDENDLSKITLENDGTVKITFNDGKKDKEIDLGKNHVVSAEYKDKKVVGTPGTKQDSQIVGKKGDEDYTFPNGTIYELPKNPPAGISIDKSGKVTYTVPDNFDFEGQDTKDVTGKVIVKVPGDDTGVEEPYKFIVEKAKLANLKYVDSTSFNSNNPQDILEKFRADDDANKYPTTINKKAEKTNDSISLQDLDYGDKGKNAPKFVGYSYKKVGSIGALGKYNTDLSKAGTIYAVYEKLDEIQEGGEGKTCPDGYVTVTFKHVEGAKVGGVDGDKVYYVNPKAGVKIQSEGTGFKLVGKNSSGQDLKIDVPAVVADSGYTVKYAKPSDNQTTTWPYDNYNNVNTEITSAIEFNAQVEQDVKPEYAETNGKVGEEVAVTPSFKKGTGDAQKPDKASFKLGNNLPQGITAQDVTVDATTGEVKYTPKDGDAGKTIEIPVVMTVGTQETPVTAKIKVANKSDEPIQPDDKKPEGQGIVVNPGQDINPKDLIKDPDKLPEGSSFEFENPIDTSVPGEQDVVILVKDPNGNVIQRITVKVIVTPNVIRPDEDIIRFFPQHDYTPTYKVKAVIPSDMTTNKVEEVKANVKENIYIEKLYMNGISSDKFAPEKSLTRAEAAQILSNALKEDGYTKTSEVKYNDLKANAWYMEAIKRVTAAGVFEGYEDGSFKPDKKITRAEWISTLVRFQKLEKAEGNSLNLEKHWALADVEAAYKAGWLDIYTNGIAKLELDGEMPRCEVAAVTNKAFNKLVDKKYLKENVEKLVHFKDVREDSPYYEEILAAANNLYRDSEEIKDKNYVGHEVNGLANIELANKNVRQIKFQREAR